MKTTVTIQADMVRELMEHYGARTKTAAVNRALEEQLRLVRLRQLADLLGGVDVDEENIDTGAGADRERREWLGMLGYEDERG